jgi:tRNA G18 (ribose-2'-O)-methylase SpoU
MILALHHVTTLDNPGLDPYRTLKRPLEHRKAGLFVAEGTRVVERFLESRFEAISILLTQHLFEQYQSSIERRREAITVYIAEKKLLETIVGFECHQGIMALGKVPGPRTMQQILEQCTTPRLFVATDGITSAENTGVLARNCAACGVSALIAGERSADPWLRRSVRNSMGTLFLLPTAYADTLALLLRDLRNHHGFRTIAAHPRPDSTLLFNADFTHDTCLVFGSEGEGISEAVLTECCESITIPMANGVDSFNVASASAIVLYEAMCQRMKIRPEGVEPPTLCSEGRCSIQYRI